MAACQTKAARNAPFVGFPIENKYRFLLRVITLLLRIESELHLTIGKGGRLAILRLRATFARSPFHNHVTN